MAQKEYTKLAGRGRRKREFFAWNTLWLGRDHLLQVEHTGYSEEYKRFYFTDIQGVSLCGTKRAQGFTIFFLLMIALGAALAVTIGLGQNGDTAWLIVSGFWTGLFVLLATINFVKGPSCICFIQTAVHREQLPSLKRIRKTHRVLARIRELIVQAQGSLSPDETRAHLSGEPAPATGELQPEQPATTEPLNPPPAE